MNFLLLECRRRRVNEAGEESTFQHSSLPPIKYCLRLGQPYIYRPGTFSISFYLFYYREFWTCTKQSRSWTPIYPSLSPTTTNPWPGINGDFGSERGCVITYFGLFYFFNTTADIWVSIWQNIKEAWLILLVLPFSHFLSSLCSLVCKWTYSAEKGWDDSFWKMVGLEDFVADNYSKIGKQQTKWKHLESNYVYVYMRILSFSVFLFFYELKCRGHLGGSVG